MRPRYRKVIADLWDNKARTALVVASITIGVFAVGMISTAYLVLPEAMNRGFVAASPVNIKVATMPFGDDLIKSVSRIPGVGAAEGRQTVEVRITKADGSLENIELIATKDTGMHEININNLIEGKQVPDDNELLMWRDGMQTLGFSLGDIVTLELEDGTIRKMPIVGVVDDLTHDNATMRQPRGYITLDTVEWLQFEPIYNNMWVTVDRDTDDGNYIASVSAEVQSKIENSGRPVFFVREFTSAVHPMASIAQAVLGILSILGLLIVFLSGSLIANTLNSLITQHTRQIGVMKLIGARTQQITAIYLIEILAFSAMALAISIPLGAIAGYELSKVLSTEINVILPDRGAVPLMPLVVALQVFVGLAVPLGVGIFPIRRGAGITVEDAVTGGGKAANKESKSWFDRTMEKIKAFQGPMVIALRNTFRAKGRLALTLFTLALGGGIFIAVFNVRIALHGKVDEITGYFAADVNLDFDRNYRTEEIEQFAKQIPGVDYIEGWSITLGDIHVEGQQATKEVIMFAPPADSRLIEPVLIAGRWVRPGDQRAIALNEAYLSVNPDAKPGDQIQISVNGKEKTWTIVGIYQFTGLPEVFGYTTYETLSSEINSKFHASSYRIATQDHSLAFQQDLSAQIDAHFQKNGFLVKEAQAGGEFRETMTEQMDTIIWLLLVMALLTAVVGSIGLAGTLSMNILERTREIGVLRAIGGYNSIVVRLVMIEGLIIGLISFLLAAAVSFPISTVLSNVITIAIFKSPADFTLSPNGFLIWSLLVAILTTVASLVPARNAAQLTIREVLSYE